MSTKESVLITGCSDGGAGSALVITFQAQGYLVHLVQLDVTKKADISAAVETVRERSGGILTYLVDCAGRNHFMPLLDDDIEISKALYVTNFWGPFEVTQAFVPLLVKPRGTIVFIISVSGHLNVSYQGIFAEFKRFLAPFDVKVLSVVTGALQTMGQTHFDKWKLPADSAYYAVESIVRMRARGQEGAPRMEAMEYARRVVSEITKGRTGKLCGVQLKTGLDILAKLYEQRESYPTKCTIF
ncbi:NAD(P)-binding protein [Xylariaceae sp. AK1471]|nr:NAD(P)-binding protein [Xylariaceae sp. AK1471]